MGNTCHQLVSHNFLALWKTFTWFSDSQIQELLWAVILTENSLKIKCLMKCVPRIQKWWILESCCVYSTLLWHQLSPFCFFPKESLELQWVHAYLDWCLSYFSRFVVCLVNIVYSLLRVQKKSRLFTSFCWP